MLSFSSLDSDSSIRSGTVPRRASGPTKKTTNGKWRPEEDALLAAAVKEHNAKNWKAIAEYFPDKTYVQCLHRWQKVLDPNLVKGAWSREEDAQIISLVEKHGSKWSEISKSLPGRIGKQCRERWHNHLDPAVYKGDWTKVEEMILICAHKKHGNRWSEIAKFLPRRAENSIKNHWNCSVRKRSRHLLNEMFKSECDIPYSDLVELAVKQCHLSFHENINVDWSSLSSAVSSGDRSVSTEQQYLNADESLLQHENSSEKKNLRPLRGSQGTTVSKSSSQSPEETPSGEMLDLNVCLGTADCDNSTGSLELSKSGARLLPSDPQHPQDRIHVSDDSLSCPALQPKISTSSVGQFSPHSQLPKEHQFISLHYDNGYKLREISRNMFESPPKPKEHQFIPLHYNHDYFSHILGSSLEGSRAVSVQREDVSPIDLSLGLSFAPSTPESTIRHLCIPSSTESSLKRAADNFYDYPSSIRKHPRYSTTVEVCESATARCSSIRSERVEEENDTRSDMRNIDLSSSRYSKFQTSGSSRC